jgi:hypothetical protein
MEKERPGRKKMVSARRDLVYVDPALADRYTACLRTFLRAVTAEITDLERDVPGLAVSIKKQPEAILGMLPRMLGFEQMSFLEITYCLSRTPGRMPGIRFWLEGPLKKKRLRAVLFEDTRVWDVSYDLRRLYTELAVFVLEEGELRACPAPSLSAKIAEGSDWRVCLRLLLRAPVS